MADKEDLDKGRSNKSRGSDPEKRGEKAIDKVKRGRFYVEPKPLDEVIAATEVNLGKWSTGADVGDVLGREKVWKNAEVKKIIGFMRPPFASLKNYIDGYRTGAFDVPGMYSRRDFWKFVDEINLWNFDEIVETKKYKIEITTPEVRALVGEINDLVAGIVMARSEENLSKMEVKCNVLLGLIDSL